MFAYLNRLPPFMTACGIVAKFSVILSMVSRVQAIPPSLSGSKPVHSTPSFPG